MTRAGVTSPRRARAAAAIAVGLACAAAAGCSSGGGRSGDRQAGSLQLRGGDGGADEAVPVEVVTLATGPMEAVLRFSTNLAAERQVQVLARAPGLITALGVEEGDAVTRGQVLVQLEQDQQRLQLERVDNDLARAQRELDRHTSLHERGVVSDEALQTARYEHTRLELARKDAALALRYTVVRAPIAGTITRRAVKRGDTVAVSQPLFEITDFDSLVAQVFVPEKQLSALRPRQRARITGQASGSARFAGVVDRIAPTVDPRSGTVKVTIAVPRPDGVPAGKTAGLTAGKTAGLTAGKTAGTAPGLTAGTAPGLMPGMFADVELVTDTRADAVLLPKRALVYDNDIPYAFVVAGDRVERRRVDVALESRDHLEPAGGFAAGDRVVIAGQVGLKDGARVDVTVADGAVHKAAHSGKP